MYVEKFLERIPSLLNKTYVVTGANSGLGFALSTLLVSKGARVIMANRNPKRSEDAINKIRELYPAASVMVLPFDQSKKDSIEAFVNSLISHNIKPEGFVLNAGIYSPAKDAKTEDGVALTFGINYLGNFIFTQTLANHGLISAETRIIYISSPAYSRKFSPQILARAISGQKITRPKQYAVAKTAQKIFVLGLMTKSPLIPFENKGKIYLYHPGIAVSNIARFKWKFFNKIVHRFMSVFFHPPEKAVLGALVALTTDKDLNGKILVPRGFLEINGIPRIKKIDEKLLSHLPYLITETLKLI